MVFSVSCGYCETFKMKKTLREMQTLRVGCSKVETKIFTVL